MSVSMEDFAGRPVETIDCRRPLANQGVHTWTSRRADAASSTTTSTWSLRPPMHTGGRGPRRCTSRPRTIPSPAHRRPKRMGLHAPRRQPPKTPPTPRHHYRLTAPPAPPARPPQHPPRSPAARPPSTAQHHRASRAALPATTTPQLTAPIRHKHLPQTFCDSLREEAFVTHPPGRMTSLLEETDHRKPAADRGVDTTPVTVGIPAPAPQAGRPRNTPTTGARGRRLANSPSSLLAVSARNTSASAGAALPHN
jgi:hypothetical protein